jgi:multiple sugar transport system substrate-binding protein
MRKVLLLGAVMLASTALGQGSKVITIAGYDGPADVGLVNDLINKFVKPEMAKQSVDVKYTPLGEYGTTIKNQLSAGNAPDVFYLEASAAPALIASGKILPLDGLVNLTPFNRDLQNSYKAGGKTYGVTKDFNTLALYYNKDLFDDAKVAYPNENDTWTTFEDKITKVQKALGSGYYGTCFPAGYDRFGAFAAATGWKPFGTTGEARTNVRDPRFVRAVDWYTGLVKKKVAVQPATINAGWGGDCLKSGKVATALEGAWMLGFLRDNAPNLQYGTTLLPKDPVSKKSGNLLYTVAWAVNADTKNRAEAVKVLNLLTSAQAQQYVLEGGLALPSRVAELQNNAYLKKATPESQANATVFRGATAGFVLPFTGGKWGDEWYRPINDALKSIMDGQATTQAALLKAQNTLNTLK